MDDSEELFKPIHEWAKMKHIDTNTKLKIAEKTIQEMERHIDPIPVIKKPFQIWNGSIW